MSIRLTNLTLVVVSTILSGSILFGAGEAYLRIKFGNLPIGPLPDWTEFHADRGWALKPGSYSFVHITAFRKISFSINELGLRNAPVTLKRPDGLKRITVVGDSFIFGEAVNDPSRITNQLQKLGAGEYEVVNISVPGYGTGQEYLMLEELIEKGYDPGEFLILTFFTNDIQDNLGLSYAESKPETTRPVFNINETGALTHIKPLKPAARKKSGVSGKTPLFLVHMLRQRLEALAMSYPWVIGLLDKFGLAPSLPRTPGIINGWYVPNWETKWNVTEKVLNAFITKFGAMTGTQLQVAFIPSPFQVETIFQKIVEKSREKQGFKEFLGDTDRPQKSLSAFLKGKGIPFIDTTPALRAASLTTPMYFPREGHLDEHGSNVAAKAFYDAIASTPKPK